MNIRKRLYSTVTVAFGLAGLLGAMSAQAALFDPKPDCNFGAAFEPVVLPNAVLGTNISGICLLCRVENASNVIDRKRNTYATLRTPVGVLASVSVSVTDTSTRYIAGPLLPRTVGFVVSNQDQLLSLDLLRGAKVTTSLNGVDRQEFTVNGLLKLDLIGLLNKQDYFVLGGAATKDFDAVRITFGSVVRALSELRVYGACVQS